MSLPKEINYTESLNSLPECTSQEIVQAPNNGATFGPASLIIFDLTSRGFIDPTSLYIRYKYKLTNGAGQTSTIRGTPVYSFFSKEETIFGSTIVESINNYNVICNMMVNLQMDVAMKYGQQAAYGWSTTSGGAMIEDLDGRVCVENEGTSTSTVTNTGFAAPLPCLLSSSERLIPAGLMPNIRIQLTCDSIANIFTATGVSLPTNYELSNVELCYTMIEFGSQITDIVKDMGEPFYIKSTSWASMGNLLNSGAKGSSELIFNMRLASIKSLFTSFAGQSTRCANGIFESIDITSSNGEYVYNIAGTSYPSRPISTLNNKQGALMELKRAVGALHSTDYNFSINSSEWGRNDPDTTSVKVPGKFWGCSVNTEKMVTNNALLTGISTQNSPITLRISIGTETTQNYNVTLMAMYDILIAVDPINRQATIKQ